jgi:hypothetical protein
MVWCFYHSSHIYVNKMYFIQICLNVVQSVQWPSLRSVCRRSINSLLLLNVTVRRRRLPRAFIPDQVLGAFTKLRKVTLASSWLAACLSVCLSTWNNSASTEWIFMKFYIWIIFWKSVEKTQVSLNCDKNNGHFTWRAMDIFYHILLNSS